MAQRETTQVEQQALGIYRHAQTYVDDVIAPALEEAKVSVGYIDRLHGHNTAAQYAAALTDVAALAKAAPELFIASVSGQRPEGYTLTAEAKRVIGRLRPYYRDIPGYSRRLDKLEQAFDTEQMRLAIEEAMR